MRLNDLVEKLPFLQRVNSVLVCEVDHAGLRAAVVNRHGDEVINTLEASSALPDFNAAVAEVVKHVREQGWVGKHAILLTPAVLLAMLDLPIPQKNKLAPAEVAEKIDWELEPLITQHLSTLALGRLLVALGFMTADHVDDVISQQSYSNNTHHVDPNKTYTYKRFGEVAIEMGYINQAQLQKCLDIQSWFQSTGDEVKCGWSAQGLLASDDTGSANMYQWLASGVNQSLLRQWQAAFTAHQIKLEYLYPLAGCAASMPDLANKDLKHQLLLEVYESVIAGVHIAGNRIVSLHIQPGTLQDTLANIAETYHSLEAAELDAVWLVDSVSNNEVEASKLHSNLEAVVSLPIKALNRPTHLVSVGMLGAARHMFKMKGAHYVAGVPVSNPQPGLLQRLEVRAFLAGLALLLTIGLAEVVLQVRQSLIESENERVSKDLKVIDDAIARVQAKVDEVKKLKGSIKDLQAEQKETQAAANLLSADLPKRNQTVISFLSALDRSISDDVVIDRIAEDPIYGFTINAWSLNDKSAQEFVKTLQVAVHPLGYKLKDVTVSSQTGRLGLMGSSVSFSATSLDDKAWATGKSSPNKALPTDARNARVAIPIPAPAKEVQ
ncbi:MAG: hypothetical protein U1C59_14840 [Methylotenera sp.]|nr:hypothetical protein [Methylotenera sp.]